MHHFAAMDDAPKVTASVGGGWLLKEKTREKIVVWGQLRLTYRKQVLAFPVYERRRGGVVDLGMRTLVIRFE